MAKEEDDDAALLSIQRGYQTNMEKTVAEMEFRRMFSNPMDPNNCFIDIQAGSGGTEAQDWAAMLERMYLRYCERRGYRRGGDGRISRRSRGYQERKSENIGRLCLWLPSH